MTDQGKTIFITGAASGIGAETARLFAKKGWRCGLYDINEHGLAEISRELGAAALHSARLDVRNRADWRAAVEGFSAASGGTCDVLFNNAGVGRHGWFEDIAAEDNDWIVDVNLKGVINGVHALLPLLRKTHGARIVNTASVAGVIGAPQLAVYSATKFAVRGLTEALNAEFNTLGVRVTSLMPWFIDTPILEMGNKDGANEKMADQIRESGADVYPVSLAAERAWDAAHGNDIHYMVGKQAERTRFMMRWMPNSVRKRLIRDVPPRS